MTERSPQKAAQVERARRESLKGLTRRNTALDAENKRLRRLCRQNGIDPDQAERSAG